MVVPDDITSANGGDDRNMQALCQTDEFLTLAGKTNTIAHIDNRRLGLLDALNEFVQLLAYKGVIRTFAEFGSVPFAKLRLLNVSTLDVEGHVNPYRSGTSAEGNGNSLVDFVFHVTNISNGDTVFRDASHHTLNVSFLIA